MATDPELPKFDALRDFLAAQVAIPDHAKTPIKTWVDKLEEWSKDRLRELEQSEARLEGYEEEQALDDSWQQSYEELVETLHDFNRGLKDWSDVVDLLPNPLGEKAPGGPAS